MSWLAVLLIGVAVSDLAHSVRPVKHLPEALGAATAVVVGLCAGLALAAAVPDLAGAAGLGTGLLLSDDVSATTLIPRDGQMAVTRRLPDEHALGRAADALGGEQTMWWRERLARCARLLSVI